jgi:5-methyltetrahydrofolate--homocysteine methyltransferase
MEHRASGGHAYVSASVGPTGLLLAPYGDAAHDDVAASFREQVRVLAQSGADLVCVETMTDLTEAVLAVQAAKAAAPRLPVMATMTFELTPRGYFTVMGVNVAQAVAGLESAGADVVGSNCGTGIDDMVGLARELVRHARRPVAIQANAGRPETRGGALVHPDTPEHVAARAAELLDLGVRVVGGCCGTTPEHVAALRRTVDEAARRGRSASV